MYDCKSELYRFAQMHMLVQRVCKSRSILRKFLTTLFYLAIHLSSFGDMKSVFPFCVGSQKKFCRRNQLHVKLLDDEISSTKCFLVGTNLPKEKKS